MGFLDFFKPKWKHSDPDVRHEAVRHLSDQAILTRVVREDRDPRIRKLALRKLSDPRLLRQVADNDPDEPLRRQAESALIEAARSADEGAATAALAELSSQRDLADVVKRSPVVPVRRLAFSRITDERLLADIARGSDDAELRQRAAEKIHAQPLLRDLALHAPGKELVALALSRLTDPDLLEDVVRRGASKAVRAAARDRLGALSVQAGVTGAPPPLSPESIRKRRQKLCQRVEVAAQVKDGNWDRAADDIEAAQREWAELGALKDDKDRELQARLDKGLAQYAARKADVLRRMRAEKEAAEAHKAEAARRAEAAQQRLTEEAERRAQQQRQRDVADQRGAARAALVDRVAGLELSDLPQGVEQARAEWAALEELPGPTGADWERRFERACQDALKKLHREAARQQARGQIVALVADAEGLPSDEANLQKSLGRLRAIERECEDVVRRVGGGLEGGEELKGRLDKVAERLQEARRWVSAAREAELGQNLRKLEELAGVLEGLVETERVKEAQQKLKEVDAAAERLVKGALPREGATEVKARLRDARLKVVARLQELREAEDWRRWAAVPRLEAVLVRLEALAQVPAEAGAGAGAASEGAEAAGEGAEAAAAAASEGAEAAGEGAEAASEDTEAAASGESAEAAAPTQAAAPVGLRRPALSIKDLPKELKALQSEWRSVGPPPREKRDALVQRYDAAVQKVQELCHGYFQARDAERAANLAAKEALCVRVEAMKDSTEWKEATEIIKSLQEEWKGVGPVPKAQSDELWRRFRGACDHYFARLKQHTGQIAGERADNQRRQEELCARAESLAMSGDWKRAADELKALQAEWKETGPAPREVADDLWKRFRGACDRFFERRKAHWAELDEERAANLAKKEALCQTVEGLLSDEHEEQEAVDLIRQYMAEWKAIGPVPKDRADPIWDRFRTACDRLRQQRWEPPPVHDEGFSVKLPLGDIAEKLRDSLK